MKTQFYITPWEASAGITAFAVVFGLMLIIFNLGRADALSRCKADGRLSYATPFKGGFDQ